MKRASRIAFMLFFLSSNLVYGQWTFGMAGSIQNYPTTFFIPSEVVSSSYSTGSELKGSLDLFVHLKPNNFLTLAIGTSYANRSFEYNATNNQINYLKGNYIDLFIGIRSILVEKKEFDCNLGVDLGIGLPLQKSNTTELYPSSNLSNYTPFIGLSLPLSNKFAVKSNKIRELIVSPFVRGYFASLYSQDNPSLLIYISYGFSIGLAIEKKRGISPQ